jgi:hypothetical protein
VSVVQAARVVGVRRQGKYVRQAMDMVQAEGARARRMGLGRMMREQGAT